MQARVVAGECLIAEEADISAADVVIVEQLIKQGGNGPQDVLDRTIDLRKFLKISTDLNVAFVSRGIPVSRRYILSWSNPTPRGRHHDRRGHERGEIS